MRRSVRDSLERNGSRAWWSHWNALGEAGQQKLVAGIAMRRMGTTDDIGNAELFFASDKASWITGQVLLVDGGA